MAFFKFSNTLIFLNSFDDDADPDNGINIPTGIADLLTGTSLNFEEPDYNRFKHDLQPIVLRASNMGLLNSGVIKFCSGSILPL